MKTLQKTAISTAVVVLLSGLVYSLASVADAPTNPEDTGSPIVTVVSDYRYRGISQANTKIQSLLFKVALIMHMSVVFTLVTGTAQLVRLVILLTTTVLVQYLRQLKWTAMLVLRKN